MIFPITSKVPVAGWSKLNDNEQEVSQMSVCIDRVALITEMAKRHMSTNRLVELSGVSRVTISSVRNGKSCSRETADKLSAVLGREIIKNHSA